MNTLKEVNKRKLFSAQQLVKKYTGKYIDTYPHHHEYWNDTIHQYETVYEVRGTSKTIKECYNLPEDCIIK